jgi:hypothetical protein
MCESDVERKIPQTHGSVVRTAGCPYGAHFGGLSYFRVTSLRSTMSHYGPLCIFRCFEAPESVC